MSGFAAAGILVFAAVAGHRLLRSLIRGSGASALERLTLGVALGIACVTPFLVAMAWFGAFRPTVLGGAAWAGALLLLARSGRVDRPIHRFDGAELLTLVVAICFCIIAFIGRDETLAAGRDQQIYAEFGVALAERGSPEIRYSGLDAADRELIQGTSALRFPGTPVSANGVDQPIRPTHPLGWPVWLAIAYAMAGFDGVYAANAVVFALGGMLFYYLARKVSHRVLAVGATISLFAAPSSLWIGGLTLSEPLAMVLLLAVPVVAAGATVRSGPVIALLLLSASLIRLDSLLVLVAVIAAALVSATANGRRRARWAARRLARSLLLVLAAVVLSYRLLNPAYLLENMSGVVMMVVAALAFALPLEFGRPPDLVARAFENQRLRVLAAVLLVVLFAYAALLRPTLPPFGIISHESGLDGTRDFREDSLLNLAAYVSWPVLLLGLAGVCHCLVRGWCGRRGLFAALLLTIGLGPSLLYLWSPQISPDHPWAVRRLVPQVIPFVLLFAAGFVAWIGRGSRVLLLGGVALLVVPPLALLQQYPGWWASFRENKGVTARVAEIARNLPSDLVVALGHNENLAAALAISFGRTVAALDSYGSRPEDLEAVARWITAKSAVGGSAFLLHGTEMSRTGLVTQEIRRWDLAEERIQASTRAPAAHLQTNVATVVLARASGLDSTFPQRMFGGESAWGSHESGFYETQVAPFGMYRFTDGIARLEVPAAPFHDARALKVDLFALAPPGESRALRVLTDGVEIWVGRVGGGVTTIVAPLPKPPTGATTEIAIISDVVDPATIGLPGDGRNLGVGLIGIRPLLADEPTAGPSTMTAFRSRLEMVGGANRPMQVPADGEASFVLELENVGTAYWPTLRELGTPVGAIQIALRWHHRDSKLFVGDNRWALGTAMLPGDRTRIMVPLKPMGLDGKRLPPGDYDLRVGMVREGVGLFSESGDPVLTIAVKVAP